MGSDELDEFNIIVAGVGGQGILFTSRVITAAALEAGMRFVQSEVHGLAQRYGSIHTEIRLGRDVRSPLIMPGTLDLLIALEPIEGARFAGYMSGKTSAIVNTYMIPPISAFVEGRKIPELEEILEAIRSAGPGRLVPIPATELAAEAGDPVTTNVVVLGAAAAMGALPFDEGDVRAALGRVTPERYLEVNLRAFDLGRDFVLKGAGR